MNTNTFPTSRRKFLQVSLGITAGAMVGDRFLRAAGGKRPKKISIGLQLYAVRGAFARDVPGTLKSVAKIGYKGVEFWGYGGTPKVYKNYGAKELRRMLDDCGLRCCGMHHQPGAIEGENFKRTVENNRILGNKYIIVAAAKAKMKSPASIKSYAEFLTGAAAKAKKEGMHVGYHAHPFDFVKFDGRTAWEILFSHAGPEVLMQMDVGNCLGGGGDPVAMLKKFPRRTPTIHVKEFKEKTFESPYYAEVFRLCETTSRTRWYIVEMGDGGGNGLDIPREALKKLQALGK